MTKPMPAFRWLHRGYVLDLDSPDVYDGDTFLVALDKPLKDRRDDRDVTLIRVRLLDVWAPEVVGAEKERGIVAREWVRCWLRAAHDGRRWPLVVETFQEKTFDRYVADVWREVDGRHLNSAIVAAGVATKERT